MVAALQCGTRHHLRLVVVSHHTFTITRTLIRLGSCRGSTDLSLATRDPSAILAETYNACRPLATTRAQILKIHRHTAHLIRSGPITNMPSEVLW